MNMSPPPFLPPTVRRALRDKMSSTTSASPTFSSDEEHLENDLPLNKETSSNLSKMNGYNVTVLNSTYDAQAFPFSGTPEEPMYKQFKPSVKELIPLPRGVLYLIMAALVVVGVAYAIVGHLIKDLAIDITDCLLGPAGDEEKNTDRNPQHNMGFRHPPHPFSHNAFHVWDQDDVVIPMSPEDSPQTSPLLLAAIPYIPSFIPHPHSPPGHSPLGSPGPIRGLTLPGDF